MILASTFLMHLMHQATETVTTTAPIGHKPRKVVPDFLQFSIPGMSKNGPLAQKRAACHVRQRRELLRWWVYSTNLWSLSTCNKIGCFLDVKDDVSWVLEKNISRYHSWCNDLQDYCLNFFLSSLSRLELKLKFRCVSKKVRT